jgi:hypothetical protein
MGWGLFKRKTDPISDRARAVNQEIAALESQIKKLNQSLEENHSEPEAPKKQEEPIFEEIGRNRWHANPNQPFAARSDSETGLPASEASTPWQRITGRFRSHPSNTKLVNYLAAGSIQGLRPLRYEKRVARRRFIALTICLFIVLWGLFAILSRPN